MTTAQKLARFGATLALAFAIGAVVVPTTTYATDEDVVVEDSGELPLEASQESDPSAAPFVLNTVNGGIQTAANATEFGLGTAAAASGEPGLGIGAAGTDLGSQAAGLGIGIPAGALGQP